MRGVSLEEISAATRISTRFLQAIEHEQWDQLPGGVFNRGFIRSVARFLGLDEDDMVAEYALEIKNRAGAEAAAETATAMPRNWAPAIVVGVVLGAILVGGWVVYDRFGERIAARLHRHATSSAAPAPKNAAAPVSSPGGVSAANAPAAGPKTSAQADPPAATASEKLGLKIEAGKPSELKVVADGKAVFEGHIEPGDVKRFDARDSVEIWASESSALFLELNGQTVAPIGLPGQAGSITLTRKDLKPTAGGTH